MSLWVVLWAAVTEWLLCWSRKPVVLCLMGSNPIGCAKLPTRCIDGFEEFLKKKGLAETTIDNKRQLIRYLELRLNLWDSDGIREHIRTLACSKKRRNNLGYAYRDWCNWKGFNYEHKFLK